MTNSNREHYRTKTPKQDSKKKHKEYSTDRLNTANDHVGLRADSVMLIFVYGDEASRMKSFIHKSGPHNDNVSLAQQPFRESPLIYCNVCDCP